MTLPNASLQRRLLLPATALALSACGPSDQEVKAMMDARVAQLQQRLEAEKILKTDAELERQTAAEAAKGEWERSNDFLAALNGLMVDYQPQLPELSDDTDVLHCVTEAGLMSDANLTAARNALLADVRRAQQARDDAERAFERRRWLQYRLDVDWAKRVASREVPAMQTCGANAWGEQVCWMQRARLVDDFGNDDYDAPRQYLYSRTQTPEPPELMRRIEAAALKVPERFWCMVQQASVDKGAAGAQVMVACRGTVTSFIALRGTLPALNIGDVVSVPLRGAAFDPIGVLAKVGDGSSWQVTATKDSLKLESPAECPSDEVIALKALEKVSAPRDVAPLMTLLRASPPITKDGKRRVAEDDLANRRYTAAATQFEAIGDMAGMASAAKGLAGNNEVPAAIALLTKVLASTRDATLLQLLGGLEVQSGDKAAGQGHLRDSVAIASDVKTTKAALAVLTFIGDTEGATQARAKACALGDAASCK